MRNVTLAVVQPGPPQYLDPFTEKEFTVEKIGPLVEANVDAVCNLLDRAGESGADLVCTPEDLMGCNWTSFYPDDGAIYRHFTEELPGPTSEKLGHLARKHNMHIVSNIVGKDGDNFFNTSFLIDRQGRITGKYRKTHLAPDESHYLQPGREFPVFETDIGRIGITICFDMWFPEVARIYGLAGADIIVHTTYGVCMPGEQEQLLRQRCRALDNTVYLMMAVYGGVEESSHPGRSCIIDTAGNVIADAGYRGDKITTAMIDMDYHRTDEWDRERSGIAEIRPRMLMYRHPEIYRLISEPKPPLHARYQSLTLRSKLELQKYYKKLRSNSQIKQNNK